MATNDEWRKNADAHKMNSEEVKKVGVDASKRPPGQNPGGVLHHRRRLPYSNTTIALVGFAITAAIFYMTLYAMKKPEAGAKDVAKVSAGVARPEEIHPRK